MIAWLTRGVQRRRPGRLRARAAAWLWPVLIGCTPEPGTRPDPVLPVYAVQVDLAAEEPAISLSGDVRPRVETVIGFRVGGKIVERNVKVGASVKRGDVLARLDPQDLALQTQAVGARSAAAQSELSQQVDELERYRSLLQQGFISQAEFDRRRNTVDIARSRTDELASVQRSARNQAGYAVLRADEPGVVTAIEAESGQVVAAGQPVLRVAQTGLVDIAVAVAENRLHELQAASALQITLWALPERRYSGTLREVSPVADPATRTYAARIGVDDADDAMRLGMTARVQVRSAGVPALHLPLSALYRNADKTAVWVVDAATSTVRLVNVTATAMHGERVAVTAGLRSGDVVVTAGVQKLQAGQKVRVVAP